MEDDLRVLEQYIQECCWKSVKSISESILAYNPSCIEAVFGKALQYYCRAKYSEMEEWMISLPNEILSDYRILKLRCYGLQKQNRHAEIIGILGGDATNLTPPLINLTQVTSNSTLFALREMALFNLSQTSYKAVDPDFIKKEVSIDPLSPTRVYQDITDALMTNNGDVLSKYTTMCDKTTNNDALLLTACGCYRWLNSQPNSGIAFVETATQEDPDLEIAWIALINILMVSGELEQGLANARKAWRRFPGSSAISCLTVSLHLRSGNPQFAWPILRQMKVSDAHIIHEMGVAFLLDGEVAEGADRFKRVLDMDVSTELEGAASLNCGHCLRILGRFDEALEKYENAIKCNTRIDDALASIGFTYHIMMSFEDAITYYNKCLAANLSHPFATRMLDIAISSLE